MKFSVVRFLYIMLIVIFSLSSAFCLDIAAEAAGSDGIPDEKVAIPAFEPPSGSYEYELNFSINCQTEYAVIHYTTDGSEPDRGSQVYNGPVTITQNTAVKAFAVCDGMLDSDIATADYVITVPPPPDLPIISAKPDFALGTTLVTISCTTSDAVIFYTLTSDDPQYGEQYTGPFEVERDTTVKAVAVLDGRLYSEIASLHIPGLKTIEPVISPPSRMVEQGGMITVDISCQTEGAAIYYTVDGSEPTAGSQLFSAPFEVQAGTTVRAIAVKDGLLASNENRAVYSIARHLRFDPVPGPITEPVRVSITYDEEPGRMIYYSLDSGRSFNPYAGPILIEPGAVIFACTDDGAVSDSASYPDGRSFVETPVITPDTAEDAGEHLVTISCGTEGATIRYTTDRSDPVYNSPVYTAPFTVSGNVTVKAIAEKTGMRQSAVAVAVYGIRNREPFAEAGADQTIEAVSSDGTLVNLDASGSSDPDGDNLTYIWRCYSNGYVVLGKTASFMLPAGIHEILLEVRDGEFTSTDIVTITIEDKVTNKPRISPTGGAFTQPIHVNIMCESQNDTLNYTLDGTEPITSPTTISTSSRELLISQDTTIRVVATSPGREPSEEVSETYEYRVATPVAEPGPGAIHQPTTVILSCNTAGSTIYYTTDGSTPTRDSSMYSEGIPISDTAVIKAFAVCEGVPDSDIMVAEYVMEILPDSPEPIIVLSPGNGPGLVLMTISCADADAVIYYTLDGTDPEPLEYMKYSGQTYIEAGGGVIKAIAVTPGKNASAVASRENLVPLQRPVIVPESRYVRMDEATLVEMTCDLPDAKIYYTTDGSSPTTSSNLYAGTFQVIGPARIAAFAYADGMVPSFVTSVNYRYRPGFNFNPVPGPITESVYVSITYDEEPGSRIYYSLDSGMSFNPYIGPILIEPGTVIYALTEDGSVNDIASYPDGRSFVETPVITPDTTEDAGEHLVTISCGTEGATIRYTTDRSDPVYNSPVYTAPFTVSGNVTVKAIAEKTGMRQSAVAVAVYGIRNREPFAEAGADQTIEVVSSDGTLVNLDASGSSDPDGDNLTYIWRCYSNGYVGLGETVSLFLPVGIHEIMLEARDGEFTSTDIVTITIEDKVTNKPRILPPGCTFIQPIHVDIMCESPYDTLNYTLDGTEPITSPTTISTPSRELLISQDTTIRVVATSPGRTPSEEVNETYEYRVATPIVEPGPGVVHELTQVFLRCETENSAIYYTTDGSTPSSSSALYTDGIYVDRTTTIKAIAVLDGYMDSHIMTAEYVYEELRITSDPVITYTAGEPGSAIVTITCTDDGAVIYYMWDSVIGTSEEMVYIGPFTLDGYGFVTARAEKEGQQPSNITSKEIFVQKVEKPVIDPGSLSFGSEDNILVSITCPTEGAEIRYTTDGTAPTASSICYTGSFAVKTTKTVRAIAFKNRYEPSDEATATYRYIPKIDACDIESVIAPAGATIDNTEIKAQVIKGTGSLDIELNVSAGATWELFSDLKCRKPLSIENLNLKNGKNTFYIKVTAYDKHSTKVYKLIVTHAR